MLLKRLTIENFKGIKRFEITPAGLNMSIYGRNGAGKTTIRDAITWLLFGKDSADRKDFEIKGFDREGNIDETSRKVDHAVEAEFDTVTLRRVFREKWKKTRGKAEDEFDGNTTEYYINAAPKTEKEYKAAIAEMCPEDVFKVVTNPDYFHRILPWKDRRAALVRDFGNITPADVFSAHPDLASLQALLRDATLDELKKRIAAEKKKIEARVKEIPARIDELERTTAAEGDKADLQAQADALTAEKNAVWLRGEKMRNGEAVTERKNRIAELNLEETRLKGQVAEDDEKINAGIRSRNYAKQAAYDDQKRRLATAEARIVSLTTEIEATRKVLMQSKADWEAENAHTWESHEHAENTTCPSCGQNLPYDKIEAAMAKAKADFNLAKANRIAMIEARGNGAKDRLNGLRAELAELQETASALKPATEVPPEAPEPLVSTDYKQEAIYKAIVAERDNLNEEIRKIQTDAEPEISKIRDEIAAIDAKRADLLKQVAAIDAAEANRTRIAELAAEDKVIKARYEELSGQQYMAETFTVKQCDMVADAINSHFRVVRWKLFDRLQNGGIEECCEAMFNGVPATANASRSENTKIGLDIIRTMSEKYAFSAPVFIDDRESTSEIPDMYGIQIINLYVSPADATLRAEKE